MSGDPYEYDPSAPTAPSPQTAAPVPTAPRPSVAPSPARYAYLVGRLRGRQITMEEATELFALQQQIIARMEAQASLPPPPPPSEMTMTVPRVGKPIPGTGGLTSEDAVWEGLPALAAAAGIFAALFKRAQSGDPVPPPSTSPSPPRPSDPPARKPPGTDAVGGP